MNHKMTSNKNPKRRRVYLVKIEACRDCYVEATTPEQAAEIAEGDTRFGDLTADSHWVTRLNKKQAEAAHDLGRILKG